MSRPTAGAVPESEPLELDGAVMGFDVVDREGELIGRIRTLSRDRTCALVERDRSLFRRRAGGHHAIHQSIVEEIDLDRFTIRLSVATDQVAAAPEAVALDTNGAIEVARHYEALAAGNLGSDTS